MIVSRIFRRFGTAHTTFYDCLGITKTASRADIEVAYFNMVSLLAYKDNMVGMSEKNSISHKYAIDDLTLAYNCLIDDVSRGEYDLYLDTSGKSGTNYWNWEPGTSDEPKQTDEEKKEKRKTQQSSF